MTLNIKTPFRTGTLLYHGTGVKEDFDMLEGPAWLSDHKAVAEQFCSWHEECPTRKRVFTFKLIEEPRLIVIRAGSDMDAVVDYLEEEHGYDLRGAPPREIAEVVCDQRLADGWHIPNNYNPGSDTVLCDPQHFLTLVKTESMHRPPAKRAAGRR